MCRAWSWCVSESIDFEMKHGRSHPHYHRASTQTAFSPIAPMANMKKVHFMNKVTTSSQTTDAVDLANNVLTSDGTELMRVEKHPDIASSYLSLLCVFLPPKLPLQAWRAQVAQGLGSCLHQGCQGAEPPSMDIPMDIPRSLSEPCRALKTTTNTVSDGPLHLNKKSVTLDLYSVSSQIVLNVGTGRAFCLCDPGLLTN